MLIQFKFFIRAKSQEPELVVSSTTSSLQIHDKNCHVLKNLHLSHQSRKIKLTLRLSSSRTRYYLSRYYLSSKSQKSTDKLVTTQLSFLAFSPEAHGRRVSNVRKGTSNRFPYKKMMLFMFLYFYLAFIPFITTNAHPHRAGTCDAGNFGLGRFHGGARQTLEYRNLVLKVDDQNIYPNSPFEISQGSHELTLTNTDGITEFKGFFFRLQSVTGSDSMSNVLLETSHFARRNPLCTDNVTGIEHTSNTRKTSIKVSLSPRDVGDYILDLHVVATKEYDWVYDQYNMTVVSSNVSVTENSGLSGSSSSSLLDKKEVGLILTLSLLGFYFMLSLFLFCAKIVQQNRKPQMEKIDSKENVGSTSIQLTPLIV